MLTAIEYNSGGEQGANGEKTKTINHHGKMRVIKLDEEGNNEQPGPAWRQLEEAGSTFGFPTTWIPSLKSIRKCSVSS